MCRLCKGKKNYRHPGSGAARKVGTVTKEFTGAELKAKRQSVLERVGYAVQQMVDSTGASQSQLSRAAGRDLGWSLRSVMGNGDFKFGTLLDIAHISNHDVIITLQPRTHSKAG